MTPEQRIKWLILEKARSWGEQLPEITAENVDAKYAELEGDDYGLQDAREEIRCGGLTTGLPPREARYFEADAVAMKCPDGKWVGWTHYYGGGKHSEPADIDWMPDAYEVTVTEEQMVMTVRTFAKRAAESVAEAKPQ